MDDADKLLAQMERLVKAETPEQIDAEIERAKGLIKEVRQARKKR